MSYSFRVRFNRAPADAIEIPENQVVVGTGASGLPVALRNAISDRSVRDAEQWVLCGSGYASKDDALADGSVFADAIRIALARVRVGVDVGRRAGKGGFFAEGLRMLEQEHGRRVLNNVHGLMAYESEPAPLFASTTGRLQRAASADSFHSAVSIAVARLPALSERERLALDLYNASFFQSAADSRFLLLAMAIEALIEPEPRSEEARQHVKVLVSLTKSAQLPEAERNSMLGTLRWLLNESINQAGKKLVSTRLGARQYSSMAATDFFSHVYQMRSNLVHGNLPYPTFEHVGAAAAALEVFVSDLITSPHLGLPPVQ